MSADAKCQLPDIDCKKEQAANQYDGSLSWGNVVEALLINLLLLAYYLTGPLTVITAASTVRPAPCTVLTAASTVRTAPYTGTTAASPRNTIAVRLLWFSYFRITLVQTPVLTQTLH